MAKKGGTLDHLVGPGGISPLSEEFYRQMLYQHKKRKHEDPVIKFSQTCLMKGVN